MWRWEAFLLKIQDMHSLLKSAYLLFTTWVISNTFWLWSQPFTPLDLNKMACFFARPWKQAMAWVWRHIPLVPTSARSFCDSRPIFTSSNDSKTNLKIMFKINWSSHWNFDLKFGEVSIYYFYFPQLKRKGKPNFDHCSSLTAMYFLHVCMLP